MYSYYSNLYGENNFDMEKVIDNSYISRHCYEVLHVDVPSPPLLMYSTAAPVISRNNGLGKQLVQSV